MAKGHFGIFLVEGEQVGGCLFWGDAADRSHILTTDWYLFAPASNVDALLYELDDGEPVLVYRQKFAIAMPTRITYKRWQRSQLKLERNRK